MVVILLILVVLPFAFVAYWLGRGYSLNRALEAWAEVNAPGGDEVSPDAIVNLATGEVLDPGTRKHAQASKVVFR